jgi:aconitate hydratase
LPLQDIKQAQVLIKVGDSVTTDHISPAGAIAPNSPAANYLQEHGVNIQDFNSYGSRRGNHEVMVRGTFANPRLRNQLSPDTQGGWTLHWPTHKVMSIFEAATLYKKDNVPLIILAGKEYGTGSSRDWAAKGPALLGIKVVIAESFERIHRSNLIGMGILPLQFLAKENAQTLKLTGAEHFSLALSALSPQGQLTVTAQPPTGQAITFSTLVRIDTPKELSYYQHGGILHYVLRKLAQSKQGK